MIGTKAESREKNAKSTAKDAIALLKADHEAVTQLFTDCEKARVASRKKALVAQICTALSVHAQIEEGIRYPDVKAALKDKLLVTERRASTPA